MPQQDPNLPESIVLSSFAGVRNTVAPERLSPQDLEAAVNVDIDDAGQARRRRGITLGLVGACHSVKTLPRGTLGVVDGSLGWLDNDLTFRALTTVGPKRVAYIQVGDDIYFSNETTAGIIRVDDSVDDWGASGSAGLWISPVINPTATLGAVAGQLLGAPPLATELEYYKGRIYLAHKRTLWATELYLYRFVDQTRTFFQFEADITLVMAQDDGLYVGTTGGLYFLKGTLNEGLPRSAITGAAVLPGSGVVVPASRVHPQARSQPIPDGTASVFMTSEGLCAGFDSGQVYNLTRERMVFPEATGVAAMYRDLDGITSYVAVADSGGTPTSSARIGDFTDATIVRAVDRGA